MEKINMVHTETPKNTKESGEISGDFRIASRKLFLAKRFFLSVATAYFTIALMASGKVFPDITIPLAKAGKIVLFFWAAILIQSLISVSLLESSEKYYKFRFFSLGIISVIFILSVVASLPFFH